MRHRCDMAGSPFFRCDYLMFHRSTPPKQVKVVEQPVLPITYWETTMKMAHLEPWVGHFGRKWTRLHASPILQACHMMGHGRSLQTMSDLTEDNQEKTSQGSTRTTTSRHAIISTDCDRHDRSPINDRRGTLLCARWSVIMEPDTWRPSH